jgi:biotin carboxylase
MNKTVLVINLGWEQEPLIREVASHGYRIVGVNADENWNHNLPVDEVHICDYRNIHQLLHIAHMVNPDAVISDECDYSYYATAIICEELSLPGAKLSAAQLTTNKWLQRKQLLDSGLLQPRFYLCQDLDKVYMAAQEIGFPIILKPVDSRGSFGVSRVDNIDTLKAAYIEALVNSYSRLVLVEEFVHGVHITIDGYCFPESGHQSLTLATKSMLGGDRQVAMDIVYPGDVSASLFEKAINNNDAVVRELGLTFGMTHVEYMITESNDIYLIEAANRGGGVHTSAKIVPAVTGIDLTKQLVFDATAKKQDLYREKKQTEQRSVILSFVSFPPGKVSSVKGVEECKALPGIESVRLQINQGDEISSVTTDGNRHGFIIATGRDREEARSRVDRAKEYLKVEYNV